MSPFAGMIEPCDTPLQKVFPMDTKVVALHLRLGLRNSIPSMVPIVYSPLLWDNRQISWARNF